MADDWRARIEGQLKAHNLNMKAVSVAAGLGETFVRDILKRGRTPSHENLAAVEDAINRLVGRVHLEPVPPEVRQADAPPIYRDAMRKDVPTLGTVAGAEALGRGSFQISTDPVDYVFRPPGLLSATGVYSLFVEGTSMSPMYEPGELIFASSTRPARPGDAVVVQDPVADGPDFEGYLKILVRRGPDWVVVRQINPDKELRFKVTPALRIHRVYTTAELFGV